MDDPFFVVGQQRADGGLDVLPTSQSSWRCPQVALQVALRAPLPHAGLIRELQQPAERWRQGAGGHLIVLDVDALEDRLVELPANVRRRLAVEPEGISHQREGRVETPLNVCCGDRQLLEPGLRRPHLGGDPLLLALEQIKRHGVREVGLEEPAAFAVEALQPLG